MAKLKKNPRNGCFAKSQKPRNDVKFASDVNILGQKQQKNGQNRIFTGEKMVLCIFWHILGKFKKIPRNGFFSKSQKLKNDVIYWISGPFGGSLTLIRRKLKKARATFEPLMSPNFIPNFKKILGAVFEICRSARTHARRRYYRTCGFQPGTNKYLTNI